MSGLGVNGLSRNASFTDTLASPINQSCYSPQEELASTVNIETDPLSRNGDDNGTAIYPSPSSTVSPGSSPQTQDVNSTIVPISRSSELAYALHIKPDQVKVHCRSTMTQNIDQHCNAKVFESGRETNIPYPHHSDSPDAETDGNGAPHDIAPYFFVQEQDYVQSPSASSSSPMGLQVEFPDKFNFDGEMNSISPNGHYHPSYPSAANGQYTAADSFATGEGHEDLELHHQMEFAQSDVYATYNGGSVDPSAVTSSIENALCNVEGFNYS
jgi:hypothetical protein